MRTTTLKKLATLAPGLCALALAPAVLAATAPSDARIQKSAEAFAAQQPEGLRPYFRSLYLEGEHNAVLNFDYLGLAALEAGEFSTAEHAFDGAITRIEAIYADNPSAKKARSLFAEEKVKDFKGEPYERAMTYFYRGLLYARTGDYQNARAAFLSAEQQSMLSEQESYASTFGLMDYLAAWASHCDGDEARASELKARAASMQNEVFASVPAEANYLALIDVGSGPAKLGVGKYKEKLTFKPSDSPPTVADITAPGVSLSAPLIAADLNWQAMTRGGRPVDAILNGKAQWKSNTEAASSTLTAVGYGATLQGISSNNNTMAQAGEIGMAVGVIGGLFAKAMTPAADIRSWRSLPAQVVLATGQNPAETVPALTFMATGADAAARWSAHSGRCSLSWGRTEVSSSVQLETPVLAESKHEAVNAQFRTMLESTFVRATEVATTSP
jgi:tetratricopeptide (TPR) repeat protein